jgi:hypothetical protein
MAAFVFGAGEEESGFAVEGDGDGVGFGVGLTGCFTWFWIGGGVGGEEIGSGILHLRLGRVEDRVDSVQQRRERERRSHRVVPLGRERLAVGLALLIAVGRMVEPGLNGLELGLEPGVVPAFGGELEVGRGDVGLGDAEGVTQSVDVFPRIGEPRVDRDVGFLPFFRLTLLVP